MLRTSRKLGPPRKFRPPRGPKRPNGAIDSGNTMKKKTIIERKLKRKALVEAGAYDGRYRLKVVPNKKRIEKLKKFKNNEDELE